MRYRNHLIIEDTIMIRKDFLKRVGCIGLGAIAIPDIVKAAMAPAEQPKAPNLKLSDNTVILFQGDSITDAGRDRNAEGNANQQNMLGNGYPLFTASQLLCSYPTKNLKIYNRGISGNKVFQLQDRWEKDCFEIKPDILSILIGVNDYWHTKSSGYDGTIETYANDYKKLLEDTKKQLPDVRLVIGEPFTVKGGSALDDSWYPDFDAYREAAKKLANEYDAVFVPYQSVFDKALKQAPSTYWSPDGVHPSMAGAQLMANAWLEACGL